MKKGAVGGKKNPEPDQEALCRDGDAKFSSSPSGTGAGTTSTASPTATSVSLFDKHINTGFAFT